MDGTLTSFGSIHPTGHPRAGSATWEYIPMSNLVTLASLGFAE
jgi:hypothetical protein